MVMNLRQKKDLVIQNRNKGKVIGSITLPHCLHSDQRCGNQCTKNEFFH